MRALFRAFVVTLAVASFLVPVQPAQAADAGIFAFEGSVTLPTFPCSACPGSFTASVAAAVLAFSDGAVGVVDGLSANFTYSELCTQGQGLIGTAAGTASGIATLRGANVFSTPLPMTAPFAWERVGLVAVLTVNTADDIITGAAVFIPAGGLPTCTGGSMTATVAGAATHGSATRHGARPYDVTAELTVHPGVPDVGFELRNSDPPPPQWTCAAKGYTVTCQPDALSGNTKYRCVVVEASVSHVGVGPVSGTSACASGHATGVSPDQPHAEFSPGGDVPFSCSVNPSLASLWEVICKVRPS